jgi:hypothetical protein
MKKVLIPLFSLLLLLAFSANILACACCAEPGTYSISTERPDEFKLGLLEEMKFDKNAVLYTDAAGFDDLKGLVIDKDSPDADQFDLINTFTGKKMWKFTLKTKGGKTGILTLPVPSQMVSFKVDIHDSQENAEPGLYKEFRFKGAVTSGTGIFKSGILKPTTYFLVFQGRGNNCDNASDFTHWHLEIDSKNANYAFFGKMATAP